MATWWSIKYFDKDVPSRVYNNKMVPFKLLPELAELNVKKGHKFKTDQFEIEIPGSDITLHMPSKCIWIKGKPYPVNNANRVILFNRNYHKTSEESWQEVCLGLLNNDGNGILVKYHMDTGSYEINEIKNGISDLRVVLHDQPRIPELNGK